MDKTMQRKIWNENRGYAGKSRKWAYRRSKRAIRALREGGDTHQLQLYGLKGNSSPKRREYDYLERHWVEECKRLGIAPVAARWYLWDRKQGQTDSRYWSYAIEGGKPSVVVPRQLELFTWKETLTA